MFLLLHVPTRPNLRSKVGLLLSNSHTLFSNPVNNFQDISREITAEHDIAMAEEAKELARLELLEEMNLAEQNSANSSGNLSADMSNES